MHYRIGASVLALVASTAAAAVEERATATATTTLEFWPNYTGKPSMASGCASVSSAWAVATGTAYVKPSEALACLMSVPVDVETDIALIDFYLPYFNYHSTLGALKDPPKGYLYPGVDIIGGMQEIREKLRQGGYTNQYEFTQELAQLMSAGNDGHLAYYPGLNSVFTFQRGMALASVSSDGLELPKIYDYNDLVFAMQENRTSSPISSVDGIDIETYVTNLGYLLTLTQDPDASYNAVMESPAFRSVGEGGGGQKFLVGWPSLPDTSNVTYVNGSSRLVKNTAILPEKKSFKGINTGADLHAAYELPPRAVNKTTTTTTTATQPESTESESTESESTGTKSNLKLFNRAVTTMGAGYPQPLYINQYGYMGGYFLNGSNSDVCVLAMASFAPTDENADSTASLLDVRRVIQSLIKDCLANNRDKLVIDVSGNPGGHIFEGYELYRNLFPNATTWSGARLRAHPTFNSTGELFYGSAFESNLLLRVTDGNGKRFGSWDDLYGPALQGGDISTNILLLDFENGELAGNKSDPVWVTGFGKQEPIGAQPFKAENIVVVTDGYCASTCTIFTGLMMREAGVKTIGMGGRPINQPMQAIGGTKGSNDRQLGSFYTWTNIVRNNFSMSQIADDVRPLMPKDQDPPMQPLHLDDAGRVNWRNAYSEKDQEGYPLHFVYEAANCRLFNKASYLLDVSKMWADVANVTWHGGKCVSGSTVNKDGTIGNIAPEYSDSVLAQVQPYDGPGSAAKAWAALLTNTTGTDATLPEASYVSSIRAPTSTSAPSGTGSGAAPTKTNAAPALDRSMAGLAIPFVLVGGALVW